MAPTLKLGLTTSSRSTPPPTTGKSDTSPAVMMRDRADTEADLGTRLPLPPGEARGFSGPGSLEPPRRRPLPASRGRGVEFQAPVLLLRRRAWLRTAVSAEGTTGVSLTAVHLIQPRTPTHLKAHLPERLQGLGVTGVVGGGGSGSPRMKTGFWGSAGPDPAPSSSEEKANLGMSKLMVLRRAGLGPRSV